MKAGGDKYDIIWVDENGDIDQNVTETDGDIDQNVTETEKEDRRISVIVSLCHLYL